MIFKIEKVTSTSQKI